jgi:hypothetical protein
MSAELNGIEVISALGRTKQSFLSDRRYRFLRKELAPLADGLKESMFDGMNRAVSMPYGLNHPLSLRIAADQVELMACTGI